MYDNFTIYILLDLFEVDLTKLADRKVHEKISKSHFSHFLYTFYFIELVWDIHTHTLWWNYVKYTGDF